MGRESAWIFSECLFFESKMRAFSSKVRRVWKILFTPWREEATTRRNESKNEICVTFINESGGGGEENLQHRTCFGRVWTFYKFIECLHACTLHCRSGCQVALSSIWGVSGFAFLSLLIFNSHSTDLFFLAIEGGIFEDAEERKARHQEKRKRRKTALNERAWGGEEGKKARALHCDSNLKLIFAFFASLTLRNLENRSRLHPTHFPNAKLSPRHRQTNKTYKNFSLKI